MEVIAIVLGMIISCVIPFIGFEQFGLISGNTGVLISYFLLGIIDSLIRRNAGKISRISKYAFGSNSLISLGISVIIWFLFQKLLLETPPGIQGFINMGTLISVYGVTYLCWSIYHGLKEHYQGLPNK